MVIQVDNSWSLCETESFERFADELRGQAASAATEFSKLESGTVADLGESQAFQLHEALKLYHFVNPKLLLFTSAVRLALDDPLPRQQTEADISANPRTVRGIPSRMFPMMMVEEEPDDSELQAIFDDIKQTLALGMSALIVCSTAQRNRDEIEQSLN